MKILNPFYLYEKADEFLMKGANKAVRAYNWTTGKTKADLANNMLTVSCPVMATGLFLLNPNTMGMILWWLLGTHLSQKENTELEQKEINSSQKELKNLNVEENKKVHEFFGSFNLTLGGSITFLAPVQNKIQEDYASTVMGTAIMIIGASNYIMRADYLPPRRSVVKRAKDKLVEKLNDLKPVPEFEPVLINKVGSFEDYVVA